MKQPPLNGFTLIETLIAMAIFSIVITGGYSIYTSYSSTATTQNASAWAQQNVRGGLEMISQDLRMAGFDLTGEAGAGLEETKKQKIRITSDRNKNGDIDNTDFERVSYTLSGSDLYRILYEGTNSQSTSAIIQNVTDLEFTYSDSCVTVSLAVAEPAGKADSVRRSLETTVYCRNLDY